GRDAASRAVCPNGGTAALPNGSRASWFVSARSGEDEKEVTPAARPPAALARQAVLSRAAAIQIDPPGARRPTEPAHAGSAESRYNATSWRCGSHRLPPQPSPGGGFSPPGQRR